MPNPIALDLSAESELRTIALERLRLGTNPFVAQVAAVGTADESVQSSVPEFIAGQLSELFGIISTYREGRPTTRTYPLLGDRGTGKTHLLYVLRAELRQRAVKSGDETMVVVVDRLSIGMDATDYLLWQIANYLLAKKGDGERMLEAIAGRLTGRLLAESLRRLAPHQRVALIQPKGTWDWLRLCAGSASRVRARLDGIETVIETCGRRNLTPEELQRACQTARLVPAVASGVIEQHLERTESADLTGWFRKRLYSCLAKLALLDDREPFEDLHAGDYEGAPANVTGSGNLSGELLKTWIELLTFLNIPLVVIFDQLEDYLRSADHEQEKINRRFFTGAAARFINELKHVCILIFAEEGFWTQLMNDAEPFARERLTQPFAMPGRPSKPHMEMPSFVLPDVLTRLVQQRVRVAFPELDLTGLPPAFPFEEADLKEFTNETSIRGCLRRLAKRYNEIVYPDRLPESETFQPGRPHRPAKHDLHKKLDELWRERLAAVEEEYGANMIFRVAFIPEVQSSLHGWLQCLKENGLTGSGPWHKVELLSDPEKQPYDNLCVVRTDGPHAPGIGIAAWLGTRKAQSFDLKQRVAFFSKRPCPIQTLIMLRADGEGALNPETVRAVYNEAIRAGRDLRIHKYEPKHLHALMAFVPWLQIAMTEVADAKADPDAERVFHDFLAKLSAETLGWIDDWRQPVKTATVTEGPSSPDGKQSRPSPLGTSRGEQGTLW